MATPYAESGSGSGPGVLLSGIVPPLADSYFPRELTGTGLDGIVRPGETAVLVHGGETELAPAAQGGTGKTQLAVEFAHAIWNTRAAEVLIWVNAASRDSVVTGFAQAANVTDASPLDESAEASAARFVSWLERTRQPWVLILDDLAELSDLDGLWPSGACGRVLVTTRLPGSAFGLRRAGIRRAGIRRPAGHRRQRAEPPRGPGLPHLPAVGLSRPADRGAGPGRGPGGAAARAGPGHRGDEGARPGLPGVPRPAGRTTPAHARGSRRLRRRAGHLVAGRGVRARAGADRAGLADAGAGRDARRPRRAGRRADQPGRLRLRHRAAQPRSAQHGERGRPGHGARGHQQPGAGGPGHHRSGQLRAHRAAARQRAGRGPGLPARRRRGAGRAGRRGCAAAGLAGR